MKNTQDAIVRKIVAWEIFIWVSLLLLAVGLSGCAMFQPCPVDAPAARMVDDWIEFRQDGIDEAETKMLDRDANTVADALEEKRRPWTPPTTGIPWLDAALALAGAAATVGASVKTTNVLRDRRRAKRGEPVA